MQYYYAQQGSELKSRRHRITVLTEDSEEDFTVESEEDVTEESEEDIGNGHI